MSSLKNIDSPAGIRSRKASTALVSSAVNGRVSMSPTSAGLLAVRFHPVAQWRQRFLLRAPAHEEADVPGAHDELALVLRADEIGQRLGAGQRHDVVLLADDRQERAGDVGQPDVPATDGDDAGLQQVLAAEQVDVLDEGLT